MRRINLLIALLFITNFGFSQQIHYPAELLKIMTDSKLLYELNNLEKTIDCKDFSDKLNYHDCYRVITDSGISTYKYTVNNKARPFFEKAENHFQSKSYDSALVYYKLAVIADSSLYNVMTYLGQIYDNKGDDENAVKWYKTAIGKNYIDYMAHWFLADIYYTMNDVKDAVDEIVIAQILNRNNQRIKKSMMNIFEKAERNTEDWCFNPQMELNKISDNKISIAMNEKWIGYAIPKVLWAYEPGYRESMGVSKGQYSVLEDKECLVSLLIGLENAKIEIKNDPQLRILKDAVENKHIEDYILYEIVLPQTPFVAFQLPEETILSIKDYILDYRHTR
jgi:tetratricopeptide (TPR) repeat protein